VKFIIVLLCVLTLAGPGLAYSKADFNRDEIVNLLDFGEFADEWLRDPNELPSTPRTKGTATILIAAYNAPADIKAVADYICTGTDDQNTIRNAYLNLPYRYGGSLHFSVGDFNIGAPLDINDDNIPCSLIGTAFLSYWPQPSGFTPKGTVFNLVADCQLLNYGYKHDLSRRCFWSCGEIKYIWFEGNNHSQTTPPAYRSSGVLIGNEGDTLIEHCMFHSFYDTYALYTLQHATWIRSCNFEFNYKISLMLASSTWVESCQFVGNTGYSGNADLDTTTSGNLRAWIANCYFYAGGGKSIKIRTNATDVFIVNNYFYQWAGSQVEAAITLDSTSDANVIITGNMFTGNNKGDYGIYGTGTYDSLAITGNQFHNIILKPIYLTGVITNSIIKDNIGADETLAATGNAQTFENTRLSGTASGQTVTLPDGYAVGCQKIFDMTNASNSMNLSVTHHATSAPEVFTFDDVNDYLKLEWNGHVWVTSVNNGVDLP
jgi:hypothetical protein